MTKTRPTRPTLQTADRRTLLAMAAALRRQLAELEKEIAKRTKALPRRKARD